MSERGTLYSLDPLSLAFDDLAKSDWPSAHATMVYDTSTSAVWVANYRDMVTRIDIQPAPSPPPSDEAAKVAHVTCASDAVTVDAPVVQAQRDGVNFVYEDQSGAWAVELHHESWDYGTAETVPFKDRTEVHATSAIGPGRVTVACLPDAHSSYSRPGVATAEVTVVDPAGFYVPWDLPCGSGDQFRTQVTAPEGAEPSSVVSEVTGVLRTDILERPNYPDSPRYTPTDYIIFREGQAVARTMGSYDVRDGAWHLLINACPGSGITR
jgi:hypothetical protein